MNTQTERTSIFGIFIVLLAGLFYCFGYFVRVAPSVMATPLSHTFSLDATLFGTLSAFYFYAYTPMQIFVGSIIDRFLAYRVIICALALSVAGTFMMAKASSYDVAVTGRFLQGFGASFSFVGGLQVAAKWTPKHFALFSGIISAMGLFGAATSDIVLTHAVHATSWRATLSGLGYAGIVLLVIWLGALPFIKKHRVQNPLPAHHERLSTKDVFINFWTIAKMPRIWGVSLFAGGMYLPISVFAGLWGIQYLEKFHHYSANAASTAVAMIFVGWGIGSIVMCWLADYMKCRILLMRVGVSLSFILSIILLYGRSMPHSWACVLFVIFGFVSAVELLSFVVAKEASHSPQATATAIAITNLFSMIGGLIFQRGIGQLLDWQWSGKMIHGHRIYSALDYEHAMIVVPISIGVALIASLLLKEKPIH